MIRLDLGWSLNPATLSLPETDVHLWYIPLDQPATVIERFLAMLSSEEHRRAQRFFFAQDREHFIVGRGMLRVLLGSYLHVPPATLKFQYGSYGKPMLIQPNNLEQLTFNVSHSQNLALYALACNREVGIDVEYMRFLTDAPGIAAQFFSPEERSVLHALPESERQQGFYSCWTRKEAYIKALGKGLLQPLDQFTVPLASEQTDQPLPIRDEHGDDARWYLYSIPPPPHFPDYKAALVVERTQRHLYNILSWRHSGEDVTFCSSLEGRKARFL
jgi:4'-phosphopantetheinyl transferase